MYVCVLAHNGDETALTEWRAPLVVRQLVHRTQKHIYIPSHLL
jgi:hypothetical protein